MRAGRISSARFQFLDKPIRNFKERVHPRFNRKQRHRNTGAPDDRFATVKKDSSSGIALGPQIGERFEKEFQAIRIDRCSNEPRYGSCLVCG